jgi:hypothetical protein
MRDFLDKDVAILRDRRGGSSKPMTLKDFRLRVASEDVKQLDLFDWGGCGCMSEYE